MARKRVGIQNFDLVKSPLEGTNLIEASAGTGKTTTLACIFLRLILEKKIPVKEILVVTYTVAATEELRDKIRRKIREVLEGYSAGSSEDPFLQEIMRKNPEAGEAADLLHCALRDFDEAAIFTIHGFCQRTLHESAFESGSLFDTELKPEEETGLTEEAVRDFWRKHFYQAPPELVNYALGKKYGPKSFLDLLKKGPAHLEVNILPEIRPEGSIQTERFYAALGVLREAWPAARKEVQNKLADPALYKEYTGKASLYLQGMDALLAGSIAPFPLPEYFTRFTPGELQRKTRKGKKPPQHEFFALCGRVQELGTELEREMDRRLLFLKGEIFPYVRQELPARKHRQNIQSYDDLLTCLAGSLKKTGGDELCRAIRRRYRAALIDEFQDTDPVQYAIFQNVFGKGGAILFLVGDPKQAIYAFRGADLFSYMKAAAEVDSPYTLSRNFRSAPDLITAVNTIFSNVPNPFVYEDIPFDPALPAKKDPQVLTINGRSEPPFHLWYVDSGRVADGKVIAKSVAYDLISKAVAGEISRLLFLARAGEACLGSDPLREADIAVLTRTNPEAHRIQEALSELKIPSVLYSTGNLFDSREAEEMARVLEGIVNPQREELIRGALTTEMVGMDGEGIETLRHDESGWEECLAGFRDYFEMWEKKGFIGMFRYFLLKEKVRSRLLSLPEGERRITNVLHLSEVLHREATENKLGMTGLLKWLARQRDPASPRLEEHQLRLETDANAVKVVTIHKSKGLEFPVVFCPFQWGKSKIDGKGAFTFHDERHGWRLNLVLDPESSPHRSEAEKEALAENLRLLYVSLTRAKARCYLVWGRFRDGEMSSLASVLHSRPNQEGDGAARRFKELTDEEIRRDLEHVTRNSGGTILLSDMPKYSRQELSPPEEENEELTGRTFSSSIPRDWQIASFSSITAGVRAEEFGAYDQTDIPDHDQGLLPEASPPEEEPFGIFSFPRGAKAGTFLHDILEKLDFRNPDRAVVRKLVEGKLREYGFEREWEEGISRMIGKVLAAPLDSEKGVILSRVEKKDRLTELEFYFPLQPVTSGKLKRIFEDYGGPGLSGEFPGRIGHLNFSPARGFMKGFIDLIFHFQGRYYLVDWKSNFLGSRPEEYSRRKMAREMEENYYLLQSNLYVLALHRYLKNRIPDYRYQDHFGGVFYIFLRGVDGEIGSEYGIFRDFPREGLVEALSENLILATPRGGKGNFEGSARA